MTHRIDIEATVREALTEIIEDPYERDAEYEADVLLAAIHGWQQELATDARRAHEKC